MKNLMNLSLRAQGPMKGTLKKVAKLLTLSKQGGLFGPGPLKAKPILLRGKTMSHCTLYIYPPNFKL